MARVTRPGGVVSACVWDHGGERGPLSLFWSAVRSQGDPVDDESQRAGVREGAPRSGCSAWPALATFDGDRST